MAFEAKTTRCIATWWEDRRGADASFSPETEEVEIEVHWEGDCFYVEGLHGGRYLTMPLHGIAKAMADGSAPAKGLAS
jgi:hypothetical protein